MRVTRVAWVLLFVTVLGALAWMGCQRPATAEAKQVRPPTTQVQHLRAFAKLYGHLRYFHPSDEASAIDWDRMAIHGVDRVAGTGDAAHLRQVLDELFVPVAPTLHLFPSGDTPPDIALPAASGDTRTVAWQHVGFGQGTIRSAYRSTRTNRGESPDKPLFSGAPDPGETVTKVLGAGLSCRYPLVLPSIRGQTWGPPRRPIQPLQRELAGIDPTRLKADDQRVRLAGVVIAWNVFQHFYPYFDVVKVDWDVVLTQALQRALADRTHADFARTLNWLVAQLQDGHGHVRDPADQGHGWVPWRLEWIEDQVVVTAARPDTKLLPGDVVRTVGGQPAVELMREREEYISGSPQWRRYRALQSLSARAREQSAGGDRPAGHRDPDRALAARGLVDARTGRATHATAGGRYLVRRSRSGPVGADPAQAGGDRRRSRGGLRSARVPQGQRCRHPAPAARR